MSKRKAGETTSNTPTTKKVIQEPLALNSEISSTEGNIVHQLQKHMECSICLTTFTDPRGLPCLHSFCLKCLENTASSTNKRPGDEMPCPNCRKVFNIPPNGFTSLMSNFNMNSLITMANDAILSSTMSNDNCDQHKTKPLDAYCLDCEQPICMLCLFDIHQGHKASDIVEVGKRVSKELSDCMKQISSYKQNSLHLMKEQDEKKERCLKEIVERENVILKRSKELIDRIERDTKSLLEELSSLKAQHLDEMEKERKELENQCAIIEKYKTIYDATVAKVSLVDICGAKKELLNIVEKLDNWFKTRKISSFEVLLELQDKIEIDLKSEINNFVGRIKATWKDESEFKPDLEKKVIVVDSGDGWRASKIFEFNLHRPNEISKLQPVPNEMQSEAVAVTFDNKLYLIGVGEVCDEIWKFERISGWKKCANLENGRSGLCANIIDTLIYICGGCHTLYSTIPTSVEAYDLQTNRCSTVGELVQAVCWSASVAYKGFIYIFGGILAGGRKTDCIQIFNTRDNTCSLFSKPMPSPRAYLRALSWNNSVILLNAETCFIFDFERKILSERKQFKTGVHIFGLVHDEEKVYVFGGNKTDGWTSTDEIKSVLLEDIIKGNKVEWKLHGRLPKSTEIYAYA